MWVSLGRKQDPFKIVPGIPINERFKDWTNARIRRRILYADNMTLNKDTEALDFLTQNGPDTLINCLSINFRVWEGGRWVDNTSMEKQRQFLDKFYQRCSHSYEKPCMTDRGIQIILNSTTWEQESHQEVYRSMKDKLGLDQEDESKLGVIINTCMSPWLKAHKTFLRTAIIVRNELYNAYGAMTDEPLNLTLVSPNIIKELWDGFLFAELEASFANPSLRYHCIGRFAFHEEDLDKIIKLTRGSKPGLLKIRTVKKMTVYDLMTGTMEDHHEDEDEVDAPDFCRSISRHQSRGMSEEDQKKRNRKLTIKLDQYGDQNLKYSDIVRPELEVEVFVEHKEDVKETVRMKLKRIIRYHHLTRDQVDEDDYPPTQEYFLYSDKKTAFLSHCPNRFPDFQQLIQLDQIPTPTGANQSEVLYKVCWTTTFLTFINI